MSNPNNGRVWHCLAPTIGILDDSRTRILKFNLYINNMLNVIDMDIKFPPWAIIIYGDDHITKLTAFHLPFHSAFHFLYLIASLFYLCTIMWKLIQGHRATKHERVKEMRYEIRWRVARWKVHEWKKFNEGWCRWNYIARRGIFCRWMLQCL